MLAKIRLLQIGDIHLVSNASSEAFLDDKDTTFPFNLKNIISRNPLKTVFRRIYEIIEHGDVDCVLIMGDLTDYGKLDGYAACAKYLASALQIGSKGIHHDLPVGIVPGNHDIDRGLAKDPGSNTKFAPLLQALAEAGLPPLPVVKPIPVTVPKGPSRAEIFLLNSCWGCGEEAFIPPEFRTQIAAAIEAVITGPDADGAIKAYYDRQLDTPAIAEDSIAAVVQALEGTPGSAIAVLVAHHNLLPQRRTRLAPYTELVNGGALRGALGELGRPVVYLHGHIHEDPVEVVQLPNGAPLVSISAPDIPKGFNLVDILFGENSLPLACHVTPFRMDKSGLLKRETTISISLNNGRRRSSDRSTGFVFAKIVEAGQIYWPELKALVENASLDLSDERLTTIVEELFAEKSIDIGNYDLEQKNWILRGEI
ncbi:metallophosphoesterase family protein [Rhizobium bangladeshense]|uniref:metallophosphoesterase family protein n=1 Tax=Rhizobium bangladeshense TaxID=1138189 RepID=UPI0007E59316|nr:metallophosphoesterase [Rhizobium bangladeshense]